MDKPKMVFAGVDAGAKIFVELNGEPGVAAPATAMKQTNNAKIRIVLYVADLCGCRIFHSERAASAAVCLAVWIPANVTAVGDWEITLMCYAVLLRKGCSKTLQSRDAF
jgi:hypothetical protein